jgi:hypothetical protein
VAEAGNALVTATGRYFDEVSGQVSSEAVTLRALVVLPGAATTRVYVNPLTHLAERRALALYLAGTPLADALARAEGEVRTALRIGPWQYDPGPAQALTLTGGDTDGNAYLFALSAVLIEVAKARAVLDGVTVGERVQPLLDGLAEDLRDDGAISSARNVELDTAMRTLDLAATEHALAARLAATGVTAAPPDLDRMFDTDGDGIVNRLDDCPTIANPTQADADHDGRGDACTNLRCGDGLHDPGDICFVATAYGPSVFLPLAIADFDRDGKLDVASGNGNLTAWLATAPGQLGAASIYPVAAAAAQLVAADFTDDGAVDLLTGDPGTSVSPHLYRNDGHGQFVAGTPINGPPVPATSGPMCVADLNADGHADFVMEGASGQLLYYRGNGDGTFGTAAAPAPDVAAVGAPGGGVQAADLSGDGAVDLVVAFAGSPLQIGVLAGGPPYGFRTMTTTPVLDAVTGAPIAGGHDAWAIADMDGDARPDVVLGTSAGIVVARNRGLGVPWSGISNAEGGAVAEVALGDLDGDGDQDVLAEVWNGGGYAVRAFRNDGTGHLGPPVAINVGQGRFRIVDLDGDGRLDVVITGGTYGGIVVLRAGGY